MFQIEFLKTLTSILSYTILNYHTYTILKNLNHYLYKSIFSWPPNKKIKDKNNSDAVDNRCIAINNESSCPSWFKRPKDEVFELEHTWTILETKNAMSQYTVATESHPFAVGPPTKGEFDSTRCRVLAKENWFVTEGCFSTGYSMIPYVSNGSDTADQYLARMGLLPTRKQPRNEQTLPLSTAKFDKRLSVKESSIKDTI